MLPFLATFTAAFVFVFVKAFQQRNVALAQYVWIVPTALLMAVAEVFVVVTIAGKGFNVYLVAAVGLGSGLGALAATWLHARYLTRTK